MAPPTRPPMTMADFAAEIAEFGEDRESLNILIYGDPGTGKTGFVTQEPSALVLACDPGWVTARQMGHKCAIRQVKDRRTLEAGLAWLEDGAAANYKYVLLEGLTVLQVRALQEYARDAYEANPAKRVNAYQPDKPDYFHSQNLIKTTVARLVDLPVNVIITAHAQHGETDEGEPWIRPHIEGRDYMVGNFVNALMNVIGYMGPARVKVGKGDNATERQVRRVLWQEYVNADGIKFTAKDQTNSLGLFTDDLPFAEFDRLVSTTSGSEPAAATKNGRKPVQVRRAG